MDQPNVLRHVVLFSFKGSASEAQSAQIVAAFADLRTRIEQIQQFEWGTNVSTEGLNAGFSHCFTLSFASDADRDAYLVHPAHAAFVGQLGPYVEKSLVIDYWAKQSA